MLRRALHAPSRALRARSSNVRAISSLADAVAQGAPVDVHPEVEHALQSGEPVVALETTIVTHGMPQPTNLDTARSVESIVRSQGAVPATMGIIGGRIKIGLHPHELEYLADVKNNPAVVKVSRRDLGPAIALKRDGGTTCSTTLMFSAMAGIKVFATGGLGGVHRGGESTMDVSADLPELTRCPVGLVSAGVKSILDIGRTLEYLETLGVPVVSYGQTDDFPAFYTRKSGFKSPWRVDNPTAAADVLYSQRQLGLTTGAVFAVPIPEEYEAVGQELQQAVQQALVEAEEQGVHKWGKAATPWLLKRVGELTSGKSLASNVALIENTARVGGQIAVAYASRAMQQRESGSHPQPAIPVKCTIPTPPPKLAELPQTPPSAPKCTKKAELVVIGSVAVDITSQAREVDPSLATHSTVPGAVTVSLGGVGRNVAEAAHRVLSGSEQPSHASVLLSPVGEDAFGRLLMEETERLGMRTDGLLPLQSQRSAVCNMVLDGTGNLMSGVADMDVILSLDNEVVLQQLAEHQPALVAVDGNLSDQTLKTVVEACYAKDIPVFFEPTSITKSARILPAIAALLTLASPSRPAPVTYASPNLLELTHLYNMVTSDALEMTSHNYWWQTIDAMGLGSAFRMDLEHLARRDACDANPDKGTLAFLLDQGVAQMAVNLLPFFQHLVVKAGDKGLFAVFRLTPEQAQRSAWTRERTNIRARCVVAHGQDGSVVVFKHHPAIALAKEDVVNVTGAGDTLVGTILATLVRSPQAFEAPSSLDRLAELAQKAAILTLRSPLAVSPELSSLQ